MQRNDSQLVIISGPVGVGKTTAGEELSAILEAEEIGHTFVDLDGLSKPYPRPTDDRFGERIALKNLRAVWGHSQEMGTRNLIIARVIETAAGAERIAQSVDATSYIIVQLNASDGNLLRRVRNREIGKGKDWHERRAIELARKLESLAVAHIEIDTDDKSIGSIAREIRRHLHWTKD